MPSNFSLSILDLELLKYFSNLNKCGLPILLVILYCLLLFKCMDQLVLRIWSFIKKDEDYLYQKDIYLIDLLKFINMNF